MSPFQDLPFDVLPPMLSQLTDRRDWHACTLVNKSFCRVATPLLYRTLDSRIISKTLVHHPSSTLLQRPQLALYVRHVTETGSIHRGLLVRYPHITRDTLAALALCKNLQSMTWVDDSASSAGTLLAFLDVIRTLSLRELTIRTHSDLGENVWTQLIKLTGLRKISIWCIEGPPRVLQGWSDLLGATLTHLELGRCAGVPPTILISVLSQLPLLKDLRLKGAPATVIPTILTFLPNLQSLDTEYLLSGSGSYYPRYPRRLSSDDSDNSDDEKDPPSPVLRHLTVRTSSMDNLGPQKLWAWIRELVPLAGLETFRLHAFTINMGHTGIPRMFILDLASVHGDTLKHFMVGEAQLTLKDIECLCIKFPKLETLVCSTASPDVASIAEAISGAKNLITLRLQTQWIPGTRGFEKSPRFTLEDARDLMLRDKNSKLRVIAIGHIQFKGKWALEEVDERVALKFVVSANVAEEKWQT
ncbi:hypothetical protein BYT27DRAFT_7199043 [Phlegmacium glaucopus]|nr:hypothetical protein BYT27DRAFT_7199043 [Phlegmacium glaucopus]